MTPVISRSLVLVSRTFDVVARECEEIVNPERKYILGRARAHRPLPATVETLVRLRRTGPRRQSGRFAYSAATSSVAPEASVTVPSRTSRYSQVPDGRRR